MSENNVEVAALGISVTGVLDKFNGEPTPENLVERVHIEDGAVVKVEFFEDGEKVGENLIEEGGIG
jgi:hypothetical protein